MRNFGSVISRSVLVGAATIMLLALVLGACEMPWQKPHLILEPKVVAELPLEGGFWNQEPAQAISPDGKYILGEQRNSSTVGIMAISLGSGENVTFASVAAEWASQHYAWYYPAGWVSSEKCVYLALGEGQGEGQDKRGVGIMTGDVDTGKVEESAFIELSAGEFHEATVINGKSKVLIHVTGALWEYDMANGSLRKVKDNLPIYDGLFYLAISPTGEHAAYRIVGDHGGLYVLDTSTGEERLLLPNGDTMSFLPSWSPDGNWIAAYTVPQRPNAEDLQPWERYDYFEGEDGPLSISPAVTVINPKASQKKSVTVDDKLLSGVTWSSDSKALAFFTGTEKPKGSDPNYIYEPVTFDGAMMIDVLGESSPYLVTDLASLPGFKDSHVSGSFAVIKPEAKAIYFTATVSGEAEFWYGAKDKSPQKIGDGYWSAPFVPPVYQGQSLGLLTTNSKSALWLLGPESQRIVGEFDASSSWLDFAGYSQDILIVRNDLYDSDACRLTVYRMFNDAKEK